MGEREKLKLVEYDLTVSVVDCNNMPVFSVMMKKKAIVERMVNCFNEHDALVDEVELYKNRFKKLYDDCNIIIDERDSTNNALSSAKDLILSYKARAEKAEAEVAELKGIICKLKDCDSMMDDCNRCAFRRDGEEGE